MEAFIPANGRAIQGATSHCLGQNFARMFGIEFADEKEKVSLAWQNSWGLTTRTIGVCIMVHGDDTGLILPPRVAPIQVVVVHIPASKDAADVTASVKRVAAAVTATLSRNGVRSKHDDRDVYTPAWKFAHWEQKGVPLRVEVGPRDVAGGVVTVVRRDTGGKATVTNDDTLLTSIETLLNTIQADMLEKARAERDSRLGMVTDWDAFVPTLDKGNMVLAPWCERIACEEWVKEQTGPKAVAAAAAAAAATAAATTAPATTAAGGAGATEAAPEEAARGLTGAAKSLCIPFGQPTMPEGQLCFCGCGHKAVSWTLWGRSY